ncbi:MAG TPA: hypothetical protein VHZ51_28705 [Ktedonobacteraceae bacterium]|jgi:hypothetical protein|nr:hypothetical protein [Ktedonobacteraceae bacterium]
MKKLILLGVLKKLTIFLFQGTYRRWLSKKYLLYSKAKQALDMELAHFQANLDHTTYRSVRSAALATVLSELRR